jgi:hypothetical protein
VLPSCDAVNEHVPELTKASVVPVTVQTSVVVDDQETVSPEDAVAALEIPLVVGVQLRPAKFVAVIVWLACEMTKL